MATVDQTPPFEDAPPAFGLVGNSPEIQRVLRTIHKLKNNRWPVLLLGESGTGKELVARAIHAVSPGPRGVFVPVDSAALPSTLVESELFGHLKGSFTGATADKRGLIEQADGGTLFLDEVGELPLEIQAKLLRALQEKQIRPVGGARTIPVDLRLIAATNRDLAGEVKQGGFRLDLFYRLNVVSVPLAPLRDRCQDIPSLVQYFLARYAPGPMSLSALALQAFAQYAWPGNVRELENSIQRMVALASGAELQVSDLPSPIRNALENSGASLPQAVVSPPLVAPLADVEKLAIQRALEATRGDRQKAARLLGIGKTTLYRKLKEYALENQARARSA